jgi:glycerol-3-phosphate dehydrogenase
MDDNALGLWAADKARKAGVVIRTETKVQLISTDATLKSDGKCYAFDVIVNVAGPWARQLLDASAIPTRHDLDLVRGSHLLLHGDCRSALLLQAPTDGRACFILPYQGNTLVGSTEVRQTLSDPIECNAEETSYLQELYNFYFPTQNAEVIGKFSGIRPLIRSHTNPNKATREYGIEKSGKVISVFGGKWTTARALGLRVAEMVTSR